MNLWQSFRAKILFFRSKVALRIFVLFILCALVPLSVLAFYSFSQVTSNLYTQTYRQLHQTSKASGMTIFERLLMLEADLRKIQCVTFDHTSVSAGTPHFWQKLYRFEYRKDLTQRISERNRDQPFLGAPVIPMGMGVY